MDEIWDSWDVGLSSVSSIFWLTQITPRVVCHPHSQCHPSALLRPPAWCHKVWVPRDALGVAGGAAPAQQHPLGWSLSSQHSQCPAEGSKVRGDPTSQGHPSSPQDILFAAPTAIPGDFCVCGQRKQVWGAGRGMFLPIPVNNSRTEEWN